MDSSQNRVKVIFIYNTTMIIHNPILTGSFSVNGADLSTITGSVATSASFDARTTYLESTSSILTAASASQSVTSGSLVAASASLSATSGSLSAASASFNSRTTNLETYTTNWTATSASFARTGSNTFTAPQYVSDLTVANGFANSSASVYTDGGLLVAKDSYFSGSMFIKGNLTIYGTQSVAYITSSQLNIATNVITVNTATPSVRFGGLNVYDSGSTGTGATGSLFWDSQNNGWVYQRESGSTYSGGMLISGPRRALGTNLGDEQGLTACMIPVAQGGDHITSSLIYHDSTVTCIGSNAIITSTGIAYFNGCLGIGSLTGSGYRLEVTSPSCTTGYANLFYGLHNGNNTFTIKQFGANHPSAASVNQIGVLNSEQHIHLVTDIQACIDAGTSKNGMFIKSGGNVGIGMQSPSEKLEICGALKINGQLCSATLSANSTYIDQASGTARLLSYGPNSTTRGAITFFQASSTNACQFTGLTLDPAGNAIFEGCVGIKCSNPSYTLDVNGTGRFSGIAYFNQQINVGTSTLASNADVGLLTNTGNWYVSNIQASHYFQIYDAQAAAIRLLINTTGDLTLGGTNGVGVGTLYAGAATFSGNVTVAKSDAVNDVLLKVQQTANFTAGGLALVANNDGGAGYNFIYSSTNGGTEHWRIGGLGTTSTLSIQTGGATRLTIASTGAATFACQLNAESFYTNDTRYISNQIMSGYNTNSEDSDIWINYTGYLGGTTRFRDFRVGNGKQGQIAFFDGSTSNVGIGTIAPGYKLDVQCGWINNVGAQNASGFRYENSGAGHTITLNANNSYAQLYTTTDTSLYFGTNNNLSVKISNTGETCFKCNVHFCASTYGIMGFGEKVMDKICYIMTTSGTLCVPLDGLTYSSNFATRAIYLYGTLLDNDAAHYAHMLYFYRNDYGGLQTSTISQASLVHPSTAGQAYTFSVNDPGSIGKGACTLLLRFTSSGAGVAPGSYCTKMRIVVYNVPGL